MVRTYIRKNPKPDEGLIAEALAEIKNGESALSVAKKYGIPRSTLRSRMRMKRGEDGDPQSFKRVCKWCFNFVDVSIERFVCLAHTT